MALVMAHVELAKAEAGQIAGEVGRVAALGALAIALVIFAVFLLVIGASLWLGEWLLGSMGWGVLHGFLLFLAVAMAAVLGALGIAPRRLVGAFAVGVAVAVVVGAVLGLGLLNQLYASIGDVQLSPALDSIPAGTSARFYRYLVAHALTIRPSRSIEITLGETALLARGARTIDLAYANPLMFYVVTQNDTSRVGADANDNLQAFGALHLRTGGSQLFAELLIDDIQIDSKDRKTIQDQLGWSLRGLQTLPFGMSSSASAEYRHVNSFTYQRASYATVYQSFDAALGSELGSDADMVHGSIESWLTGVFRMSFGAGLWRQGAQRLDQRPGKSVNGSGGQPYPSVTAARPVVQRAILGDAAVRYLRYPVVFGASVEVARVRNPRNQPASTMSLARIQITGSYAYRIP